MSLPKGFKFSNLSKKKISKALKGRKFSKEWKRKLSEARRGKQLSPNHCKNISLALKGHIVSEETKRKIGKANKGRNLPQVSENNSPLWKGDNVGYTALHMWVYKHLGKPETCEHCEKKGLKGKHIDWANKSQRYLRDLNDWIRLCKSCHRKYDNNEKRTANLFNEHSLFRPSPYRSRSGDKML